MSSVEKIDLIQNSTLTTRFNKNEYNEKFWVQGVLST